MSKVNVTLRKEDHYNAGAPMQAGPIINAGKGWARVLPLRVIKRKRMLARLLKKKWKPKFIIIDCTPNAGSHTFTIKPFNF